MRKINVRRTDTGIRAGYILGFPFASREMDARRIAECATGVVGLYDHVSRPGATKNVSHLGTETVMQRWPMTSSLAVRKMFHVA